MAKEGKGGGGKKSKKGDEMTKAQLSNVLKQPIPRLAEIAKLCMQEKNCFKKLESREKKL